MKTAASITSVKISTTLEIVGKDDLRHPLNMGGSTKIIANAGEKYRIVKKHNANDVLADDVVVTKSGDNLEISYADGTHVTLDGFYSADAQLELPANDGGIHTVTSSWESLSTNESNYVYSHGNHDTLMSMTQNNQALQVAVADRTSVSDLPHYAELATGVATGAATDAVIGSAAAGTTAATSTAAVAAGTAATTGLSTMAMVGIGAVGVGGGAMVLSGGSNSDTTVPVTPVTPTPTDNTPPATIAPAGFVFTDAGRSATDALSSNPTITLTLAIDTATWQYSLDNGTTWVNGSGHTITLAEGTYDKQDVQVKQFDATGNSSISHMSTTATLESSAMVQLEAIGVTNGSDGYAQTTAVGISGAYVTVFSGTSASMYQDDSVYVQKFNADGTISGDMVELQAIGVMGLGDYGPQVTAVGTSGEYVVTFNGYDNGARFIYVQKFNADGTIANNTMVKLEVAGVATNDNNDSQITSVGTDGSFVVTFLGRDTSAGHDYSIFVQKFNADGTTTNNAMVQLEAMGNFTGGDYSPQITAVGATGEYVVTFHGQDTGVAGNDTSVFVQKFNADGTIMGNAPVRLEAIGNTTGSDDSAMVTTLGATGEFVVTFEGQDTDNDYSIFVQKFNADGTPSGAMVQLEAIGNTTGDDYNPQITAVGTAGQFVVTFEGTDADGDESVFVQKFNVDGTTSGSMVELLVPDVTWIGNWEPQITAVSNTGEFVVTFYGNNATDGSSIFVQKFDANGAPIGDMAQLDVANAMYDDNWSPQITAVGTAGEFVVTFTGTDSTGNDSVFVQKFNANGTVVDLSNTMVIDTTAPSLAITTADTTNSMYPAISGTAEAGSTIILTIGGATYTTTAIGGTWDIYPGEMTPTSGTFTVDTNGYSVSVTATDIAGNVSVAATQTLVVDMVAPATIDPAGFTYTDTGVSASDSITSDTTITVALASDTTTWQYSLDGGNNWNTGAGNSITLEEGTYDKSLIQIEQFDAAGNSAVSVMSTTATIPDMVQLGQSASAPQITTVGTTGDYVVTYQEYGYNNNAWQYSIFVQKFTADGIASGAEVVLNGNNTNGNEQVPQVTAVGTTGAYVVTFEGADSAGDNSIFVQKFNADGTVNGAMVQLEALGNTTGGDYAPQVTAVGTSGEYVVTFYGIDAAGGDYSIFVQKFDTNGVATGMMVQLEPIGNTTGWDTHSQITAVGTSGEYVVTFEGRNSVGGDSIFIQKFDAFGVASGAMAELSAVNGYAPQISAVGVDGAFVVTFYGYEGSDYSIFVQKFDATGAATGSAVKLEALNTLTNHDTAPQITTLGTGEYVVAFQGADSANNYSIYVQKFHTDGTVNGTMVKLEAIGNTVDEDRSVQIAAIGTTGEYAVTFQGINSVGSWSIFVQKFNVDGTAAGDMVQLDGGNSNNIDNWNPQISAVGTDGGYVVTYEGYNAGNQRIILVQNFNADGTKAVDIHNMVVVDTTAPIVAITSAAITGDATPIIAGTAEAGATITLTIAGATYSTTAISGNTWSVDTTTATPVSGTLAISGDNSVSVTAADIAGNVSVATTQILAMYTTAPVFTSAATATVTENTTTTVYDATAYDDNGITYTLSAADDGALFDIDAATGIVTFKTSPNYELPTDTGADNVYNFTVTATDTAGSTDQAVALNVTDVSSEYTGTTVTSNGVSFTLGTSSIQNGKEYYYVTDVNNTGVASTTHDILDTAFNGGANTVDTIVIAGVDDARTFVVGEVTYILPTVTELAAANILPADQGMWSSTEVSLDTHQYVWMTNSYNYNDTGSIWVTLQVL